VFGFWELQLAVYPVILEQFDEYSSALVSQLWPAGVDDAVPAHIVCLHCGRFDDLLEEAGVYKVVSLESRCKGLAFYALLKCSVSLYVLMQLNPCWHLWFPVLISSQNIVVGEAELVIVASPPAHHVPAGNHW
jgi:hypothetical protein